MGIGWRSSAAGGKTLYIDGPLGFACYREFFEAIKQHRGGSESRSMTVDLSGATELDSAGLGMLLMLRDRANIPPGGITLLNCNKAIKATLRLARFENQFRIN